MAKIRMGFVSNSSSSSFVIAVPKGTEPTFENLHRELYNVNSEIEFRTEYDWHDIVVNSHDVTKAIERKITKGRYDYGVDERIVGPVENLADVVSSTADQHGEIYDKCKNLDGSTNWDLYHELVSKADEQEAARILTEFPNHDFYEVEFSDGNGAFECEVEHGPALRDLPNVFRFSHH